MAEASGKRVEQLEGAFKTFNELSEQLMSSYQLLEKHVESLTLELAEARNEQAVQFEQTKRLANRLERLLNALPGGVVVLDGHGCIQETNPVAVNLLGEPLKGLEWRQVIQRAFAPHYDDGHDISLKDGRRVNISTSVLGEEPGQILLIKDVTETRELQDKLSRYQRFSAIGRMAASLAHQIRTPISSALLYVSNLFRANTSPEDTRKYAEKIREQLRYIESMISDTLKYAKSSNNEVPVLFSTKELIELLEDIFHANSESGEIEIINDIADTQLKGNKEALAGALANLITNAMHANANYIEVRFSRYNHQYITISIHDNGAGISEEMRESIFDPFVTNRPQGTGIGLAITRSIVEMHDGQISFESNPNKGTTFTLIMPLYVEQEESTGYGIEKKELNKNEVRL